MTACCSVPTTQRVKNPCPTCGIEGRAVARTTLYHQVRYPQNLSLPAVDFFFCSNPDCELGYFSEHGPHLPKSQLREESHLRSGWLCYCFDISRSDYQAAIQNGSNDDIKTFVIEQTRNGTCACTTRNPSGQCCLADFKRLEKEYHHE